MNSFDRDLIDPELQFELEEASGEVDGKHIIGKLKGTFFVPNGISRNNRFYTTQLWERQLKRPQIKEQLKSRRMFGTISHDQPLDEKALLEGKISHITIDLRVENGKGIGEALILNTPAGQILNTVLRSGAKLFVSSRALGKFDGEVNGVPKVDESSFDLKGFDIVLDPGFLQANPQLVESMNKILEQTQNQTQKPDDPNGEGDKAMQEVVERLSKENASLKTQLEASLKENEKLTADNDTLTDESNHVKEELEQKRASLEVLPKYEALGTPEKIGEALDQADALFDEYQKSGEPNEVAKALIDSKKRVEEYQELGEPEELKDKIEEQDDLIEKYEVFGTPEQIGKAFDLTDANIEKTEGDQRKVKADELAKQTGFKVEKVEELLKKLSEQEILEMYQDIAKTSKVSTYRKPVQENLNEVEGDTNQKTGSFKERMQTKGGRAGRLMESFSN